MKDIWMKACSHYDIPDDVAQSWYTRLHERLNQTDSMRCYHNWDEMLLGKKDHLQHCKPSIVLAAFFQYYNFDGNHNCVKENCEAFEAFCQDAFIEDEESKCLIQKLLGDKAMESEALPNFENDAHLLQDIDLVVLASPQEDYKKYTQLLRREYNNLSDENYKLMRLKVLQTLLMIPNIFSTPEFQTKYEEAARSNIKQEISELKEA